MREMLRYGFTLAVICLFASASLAIVNKLTSLKIIAQAQAQGELALREVMPEGEIFEPVKTDAGVLYHLVRDKNKKIIGVVFKASHKGYSSTVETIVGMFPDGTITAIKVLSQNETPGLGARVAEKEFMQQFAKRQIRELDNVQAVTGATIS